MFSFAIHSLFVIVIIIIIITHTYVPQLLSASVTFSSQSLSCRIFFRIGLIRSDSVRLEVFMPFSTDKPPVPPQGSSLPTASSFEGLNTTNSLQHSTGIAANGDADPLFDGDGRYGATGHTLEPILSDAEKAVLFGSGPDSHDETSTLLPTPLPGFHSNQDTNSISRSGNNHPLRQPHTIAASTSFFAIPLSFSNLNLRESLALPAPQEGEIDWVSLYVVYIVTLVAEAARGLLLPSTWPYYESLGGTKLTVGSFVASFSLGRMISTIPLGYLSDNASIGFVLSVASFIQVFGHFAYAISPNLAVLYFSRIVVGFGSATMSVCRAHLTRAIPARIRTHHFAYLSALQFIGFAVLPGLGGMLALLPEFRPLSFLVLNGFTYPAYVLVFANLLAAFLVGEFYIDPPQPQPRSISRPPTRPPSRVPSAVRINEAALEAQRSNQATGTSFPNGSFTPANDSRPQAFVPTELEQIDEEEPPSPDAIGLAICLLVNVVFRGVIAEFETVSVPFLMEQFGVTYGVGSFYLSVLGFIGLVVYLSFKPIAQKFSDRILVVVGLFCIIIGCLPLSIHWLSIHMHVIVYTLCMGLTWSLAFPIGQTAVLALFSKILAGLPAGGFLGIFSASGSIARLVMAILAGKLWNDFGRDSVYIAILVYVIISVFVVFSFYPHLVPNPRYSNR